MRDELIAALLRSLPKAIRRHVVPAADWAATFAEELDGQGPESHDGLPPTRLRGRPRRAHPARREPAGERRGLRARARARPPAGLVPRGRRARPRRRHGPRPRGPAGAARRPGTRIRRPLAQPASAGVRAGSRDAGTAIGEHAGCGGAARVDVRRAHRPHRLDVRRPPRSRGHEGRRRRRARLSRHRRREGLGGALRIETTPEAAARATRAGVRRLVLLAVASPAAYVLEHLTSAEKLALAASPYPSAKALDRGLPRGRGGCRHRAHRAGRGCAHPGRLRGGAGRVLGRRRRRALPDRLARRADPDGVAGGRAGDARRQLADAARRAERRQGPARGSGLPGLRVAHRHRAPRAPSALPAGRARPRAQRSPTTPAAIGSG